MCSALIAEPSLELGVVGAANRSLLRLLFLLASANLRIPLCRNSIKLYKFLDTSNHEQMCFIQGKERKAELDSRSSSNRENRLAGSHDVDEGGATDSHELEVSVQYSLY